MSIDLRSQLGGGYSDGDLKMMNDGMKGGEGAKLPFAHLVVWAANGDKKCRAQSVTAPTSYFGGWNLDVELIDEMAGNGNLAVPPEKTGWLLTDREGDKSYKVYESRVLHLAPIAKRFSWLSKDGKTRTPEYDVGHPRSHLQILCLIGCTAKVNNETVIQYVAPGIVSAKGMQSQELRNAFGRWSSVIDGLRGNMNAKGVPCCAWWQSIGTFGPEPNFMVVGSGANSNTITPLRAVMPEKPTVEQMGKRFVGPDLFKLSKQLLEESSEWREAWKTAEAPRQRQEAPPDDGSGGGGGDSNDGGYDPGAMAPPPGRDGDIPFSWALPFVLAFTAMSSVLMA
jgi:hypothetical protein